MEPIQLTYRAHKMTSAVKNANEALNFDNRQSWIDVLRGTSILLVMLSHSYGFTALRLSTRVLTKTLSSMS